ncbi:MAG: hypothetical protein WAN08_15395 [Candidatus Sulfotelmatobacter sp.]
MARGWESKSLEAQQDEAAGRSASAKPRLTREQAARLREHESLRLSLRNIVERLERSQNSRHCEMLQQAKADLERKIEELGS